jgi:hypothetical protein
MKLLITVYSPSRVLSVRKYCSREAMAKKALFDLMGQIERPWEEIRLVFTRRVEPEKKTKKG